MFFVLTVLFSIRFAQVYQFHTIAEELPDIYKHEVITDRDKYEQACQFEKTSGYYFPATKTARAIVHTGFFHFDRTVSTGNTKQLTTLLNDPESYIWGEIGTPDFDKRVIFYDEKDEIVGLTLFSSEGQTYSYPHLNRMKWGMLSEDSKNRFIEIITRKKWKS